MNIILVSSMFPPIRTGTSFYCRNLARTLAARGHKVVVVTVANAEPWHETLPFEVVRLPAIHVPVRNYFKHFRMASLFPSNYTRLSAILRQRNADVVLLVNHYLDIAFPAIFAARRNRIPLVCSVGTPLYTPNPLRRRILKFLDRLICGNLVFPFCDRIIAWDSNILEYLHDVHGKRFAGREAIVLYSVNGNESNFISHEHDYTLHGQILCVGAVIEQRDYVPMVLAFQEIAADFPSLRLKIIGHVYYDAAVRLAAELGLGDRVQFVGEQPHERVMDELRHSDAFFASLSGKYLGMGTATVESMLMGVPTLCNVTEDHLGGPILRDMEHIVITRGLEPGFIADRLRQILGDSSLRQRIGQGGRDFVSKHLSWDKVVIDMEALLFSVVQTKRKGAEW